MYMCVCMYMKGVHVWVHVQGWAHVCALCVHIYNHVCACMYVSVCMRLCVLTPLVPDHPFSLLYSSSLVNMRELFICSPGQLGYFQLLLLQKNSHGDKHSHLLEQLFPKDHPLALFSESSGQPLRCYWIVAYCTAWCWHWGHQGTFVETAGAAVPGKAKAQTLLAVMNCSPHSGQERDRPIEKNSSALEE